MIDTVPVRRAELRGRASGVSILAFFAVAWAGWGLGGHLPGGAQAVVMVVVAALAVLFAVRAWQLAKAAPAIDGSGGAVESGWSNGAGRPGGAGEPGGSIDGRVIGRKFGIIVGIEWIGLFAAAAVLGATGHAEVIPAVICAGVGVHFFPLARLFHVPAYTLTGVALCALAAVTLILAPLTSTPALWTIIPGVGAAITLLATCAALLSESRRLASGTTTD
jgi:hypothetical protein